MKKLMVVFRNFAKTPEKKKRGRVKLEPYLSARYRSSHKMLVVNVVVLDGVLSLSRSPVLGVAYPLLFNAHCLNIPDPSIKCLW